MAWATKYQFKFDSAHGVEHRILIQKDGYSGDIIKRRLGRGPVLKKQKNGPICGTSLEIYAECINDGEFAQDFFTSNPKDLRVRLYRGNNLIWTGFVSAEAYSEPNIAPPYDVQVLATDGLGELKLVTFVPAGAVTLSEHFRTALAYAGESHTIYVASALIMTGHATTATFGMSINLDYLADKSYYDVLTALLDSLHATITMYNGNWLIARETDLASLLSGSGLSVVSIAENGTVSTTTLSGVAKTVGSLADNTKDTWPVGYLSTAIEPARREVTVEAPWHVVPGPLDPAMEATTGSPWDTDGIVTHDTTDDCFYELGLDPSDLSDNTWGTISQEIDINKMDCGFELRLRVAPRVYHYRQGDRQWHAYGQIKAHLEYDLYITGTVTHVETYIGTEEGWNSSDNTEIPTTELNSIGDRWLSVNIPAIATPSSTSRYLVSDSAKVRIIIEGHWVDVYECILTPTLDVPGYQDIIKIDNGARGSADVVEITGGRVLSGGLVNSMFYGGIWFYNNDPVTSFADGQNQGGDFLAITALSYASSSATARLRTEGVINIPSDFITIPLFLTVEDVVAWLETWDWDIMKDEVQISLLSLPANQITVESETVIGIPEGESGGSGSGTGSGSSAASAYSYNRGGSDFFEEDGDGAIKLKDEYTGFWAAGFITAGGVGTGSGGSSSVDLPRVWQSLQNANEPVTPTNNTKIAAAHLVSTSQDEPVGLIIGTGLSYNASSRTLSATGGATGTVNGIKLGTSSAYTPDANGIVSLPAYPTTLPASDVYSWAKAASKPSYNFSEIGSKPTTISGYGITDAKISNGVITLGSDTITPLTSHQTLYTLSIYGGTTKVLDFKPDANASIYIKAGGDISLTNDTTNKYITLSYSHPTGGANTTITAADGKVLSAITVNSLGHVTSVSSKTLAAADIPDLSGTYLPLSAGTGKALTGVLKIAPSNASGLQDGIILHDAGTGLSEGLKIKWTSGTYTTGVSLYPNGDLTGLTVGGSLIITAGNYMNYALPLSAGSSYPLTGTLYVSTGNGITDASGNGLIVYHPSSWTGVTSAQWGVGAIDSVGVIRSSNTDLVHYRGSAGTSSVIYDEGNANKSTIAWACSNLTASGTIHATGGIDSDSYITAGAAATSSDRRMKENIEAVSDRALSVLMQLKPCEWVWNDRNASLSGKRGAGLVAQEVQEILPFAVVDLGDYLYLNYSVFHAYEIKGLQNHETRIYKLETEVRRLLKENEELKARLNA